MSGPEHHVHATADKGLKMKIKRKNIGVNKADSKHEIVKTEGKGQIVDSANTTSSGALNGMSDKSKQSATSTDKDRSPYKSKNAHKKEKTKDKGSKCNESGSKVANGSNGLDELFSKVTMEPKIGDVAHGVKKETESLLDPYDFNTEDDGIALPTKKVKTEKVESASSPMQTDCHNIGVETCTVGVSTEPDCLGPCEPGTSVNLEGIVWHETENGVLVVNVTWRGKTYVGTLLDATKHDWAPPRFNCDSPVSDFETRTPKGRGKRNRGPPVCPPVVEKVINEGRKLRKGRRGSTANTFQAPPSPAKSDVSTSGGVKRKGRSADLEVNTELSRAKRCRSSSRGPPTPAPEVNLTPNKEGLIECPEPNCSKKYKHMNGLRYHQTHAHLNPLASLNAEEDMDDKCDEDVKPEVSSKTEKKDSKSEAAEKTCSRVTRERENSIEDNIPLKEIAASCRANANRRSPEKTSEKHDKPQEKNSDKQTEKSDKKSEKNSEKTSGKNEGHKSDKNDNTKHESTSGNKRKENETVASGNTSVNTSSNSVTPSVNSSGANSVSSSGKLASVPSQVYQISGAPVGGLGSTGGATKVTQSRTSLVTTPVVTSSGSSPSNNPHPITVPAISTPPHAVDFTKSDKSLLDKSKNKSATRPIVPAPSPQMIALTSTVSVSHPSLSPVSTHAQMSPSLKPIQPKPTIMGEPSHINPALVGFKDKKSKPKKKKEKDGSSNGVAINNNNNNKSPSSKDSNREDPSKGDRPAVIKTASTPSRPVERKDKQAMPNENIKSVVDLTRKMPNMDISRNSNQALTSGINVPKPEQSANRLSTPANLLKVNSPLQVSTDRKTPVTDDVQSPAYSDISDANESNGSPQQGDSPSKKENASKKSEQSTNSQPPAHDGGNVAQYGMYNYYGQSPYMLQQNVPSSQHLSPNTGKPRDGPSSSAEEKKQAEDLAKTPIKVEEKEENKIVKPEGVGAMPPQQMNEYQMQQQKWFQQMYAQIQTLPPHAQYQYLAAYGGYMDPSYQMHPNLRQQYDKAMEDQKRAQEQQGGSNSSKSEGESSKKTNSRPASREHPMDPQSSMKLPHPHLPVPVGASPHGGPEMKKPGGERQGDVRDQSLREKQNENHQIMKENIELKSQMDRNNRYEYDYRKQEEMRRYQMFQQQKLIEQQRVEKRKQEMAASKPPELTSNESPAGKVPLSRPQDPIKVEDIVKREHGESRVKDFRDNNTGSSSGSKINPDNKPEDKNKIADKLRSPDGNPRTPNHSMPPNHPSPAGPGNSAQSPGQQGPMPYNTYMQYPGAYLQSPHYGQLGQMHFDPNQAMYRNMNPHVLGYAPSPYLHPAQMGGQINYRVSVETEKEKVLEGKSASVSGDSEKPVDGQSGSAYFGNSHKIHELHEKARPGSHNSSPVPQKSMDSSPHQGLEKNREHSSSPPTQRHIHTHHHTHVVGPYPLVHGALLPPQASPSIPHNYSNK
ncbi:zinc finger protein 608 isoform X2 [Patella vulgata]|uniref:zinc finger protein 608 isoform X2 n=1 Tax=Patella vulgata TaxID=6465 RepID=UPI00217FC223|nr:zinc finger protein 608 isoform X2 [Patella vulgata]